jgi:hypothetical protein
MPLKAAKLVSSIILSLVILEIVGAAVTAFQPETPSVLNIHSKKSSASVFDAFLFEKAEEETEETENEEDDAHRVLLVDFSRVAQTLAVAFLPKVNLTPFAFQYDIGPPVYTLNCVLII